MSQLNRTGKYRYVANVAITNATSTAAYQHRVNLTYALGMNTAFTDLLFTLPDGTHCPHWVESYVAGTSAIVWVNVPTANNTLLYMFYGRSDGINYSNGNSTFDFFDDFLGTALDTTKWTNSGGSISVDSSVLTLSTTSAAYGKVYSNTAYGYPYAVRGYIKTDHYGNQSNSYESAGLINSARNRYIYAQFANGDSANQGEFVNNDGTTSTLNFTYPPGWTAGSFHIVDLLRNASNVPTWNIDTSISQSPSTHVPTDSLPWEFTVYSYNATATKIYCDWIAVRKYTATEPTTTITSLGANPYYGVAKRQTGWLS